MNRTKIEWVKNPDGTQGYTWNPITGCLNGCEYCYARKLANGRLKSRYLANWNFGMEWDDYKKIPQEELEKRQLDPFYPRFWPERLSDFGLGMCEPPPKKKRGIFVCDMSDLFGIGIPGEWQSQIFNVIQANPWHRFYLLTKQPQNLIKWSPFPDNCWVGQTITNQADADRTFNDFAKVEATIKYVSIEPMPGKVDISPYLRGWVNAGTIFENPEGVERYDVDGALVNHIDWVIIGSLTFRGSITGHYPNLTPMKYGRVDTLQPKIEWVKEIVEACDKAGMPVFLKDNLEPLWTSGNRSEPFFKFSRPSPGATEMGYLRQEMPNV